MRVEFSAGCEKKHNKINNNNNHNKYIQRLVLAAGYAQAAHLFFCLWKACLPHLGHKEWDLLLRFPKLEVPFVYKVVRGCGEEGWREKGKGCMIIPLRMVRRERPETTHGALESCAVLRLFRIIPPRLKEIDSFDST